MRWNFMTPDPDILTARLFLRWYRVRQVRPDLVPALLQEPNGKPGGRVYTFSDPVDPWGSRECLPLDELERLVDRAEAQLARRECGRAERSRLKEGAA